MHNAKAKYSGADKSTKMYTQIFYPSRFLYFGLFERDGFVVQGRSFLKFMF